MYHSKQNIVVVDDDAQMTLAIGRLLKAAGFHAITFSSAEDLLRTDAAETAHCLILDVQLPGLSGFELHRRLSESGAKSPVIFMTAYDYPDSQANARNAGALAYFAKPFRAKNLLKVIADILESKDAAQISYPPGE